MNNIPIKNWQQAVKNIFKSSVEDMEKMEITPYRDWRIVVVVFFAGLIASLAFNTYVFMGVNQDNFFGDTAIQDEVVGLHQEKLSVVLKEFNMKKAAFETLTKESVSVVDPSL